MKENTTQGTTDRTCPDDETRQLVTTGGPHDDAEIASLTKQISLAFTARGNARRDRGEYHLAVRDYAQALLHRPNPSPYAEVYNPEAYDNRSHALGYLQSYFAGKEGFEDAKVPMGHLVVGHGNILLAAPLTPEGRQAALEYADELARNGDLRFELDNQYLTESDDFGAVVYRHDNTGVAEIYAAAPINKPVP